jgi:putative endonuclease
VPLPFTDLVQFIAERLRRYESKPAPSFPTPGQTGNYGERVAAAFLRRHGYRVLTRNFKTTRGEIDLVCRHGEVLVFVEVKTRGSVEWTRPSDAIGPAKEEALRLAAQRYLELLDRDDIIYRFDAVEVEMRTGEIPRCTIVENLFS